MAHTFYQEVKQLLSSSSHCWGLHKTCLVQMAEIPSVTIVYTEKQ